MVEQQPDPQTTSGQSVSKKLVGHPFWVPSFPYTPPPSTDPTADANRLFLGRTSTIGLSDGASVVSWVHEGGGFAPPSFDGVSGERPIFHSSSALGVPVVTFDGTNDNLGFSVAVGNWDATLYLVAKASSLSGSAEPYGLAMLYCGISGGGTLLANAKIGPSSFRLFYFNYYTSGYSDPGISRDFDFTLPFIMRLGMKTIKVKSKFSVSADLMFANNRQIQSVTLGLPFGNYSNIITPYICKTGVSGYGEGLKYAPIDLVEVQHFGIHHSDLAVDPMISMIERYPGLGLG